MKRENRKEEIKERYKLLCQLYGVKSSSWSTVHESYSPSMFCPKNRKGFISEFLEWESFVEDAKQYSVVYYCGIDIFLQKYRNSVYSCLNNLD